MRTARVVLGLVAMVVLVLTATGTSGAAPATGTSGAAAASKLVVWTDADRKPAVDKIASAWGSRRGVNVEVVQKEFGEIRDSLKTVQAETAPDVIVGAHDWTGDLAASGLVLPLNPRRAVRAKFPSYALDAFSYGTALKRLYGAPVVIENIALVTNTALAKVPTSFADFERRALAFKNKKRGNVALAVQQGAAGDAYHMYPFFSGLCGYIFGTNRAGNLDPSDLGLRSPKFLANAAQIDRWNKSGFINAKIDDGAASNAFLKKQAAYWVTGPWNMDRVKQAKIKFAITQIPANKCRSAPFLGSQGFLVTKFAQSHGVESAAKDLVGDYMMSADSQFALSSANGRFPANTDAAKRVKDKTLAAFGKASTGGVPMPNIPQMGAVWSDLGAAWVKSTKGAGATKARTAFSTAARNIANKIG